MQEATEAPKIPYANTGFIEQAPSETDWISGVDSPLEVDELNPTGDYTVYLPENEAQHSVYFDAMDCVTRSATNCVEAQIRALIGFQKLPQKTVEWLLEAGFMGTGYNFNASDRFTAKMSGTTRKGNYLTKVWDSIRKDGLLPEHLWPYPREQRTPVFDWDDYYTEIPDDLKKKAKEFLDYFTVNYEWVAFGGVNYTPIKEMEAHIKQAPLQIAAPTCPGWNNQTAVVNRCELTRANHATMVYAIGDHFIHDFDSYNPYRKLLPKNYPVMYVLKGVVRPK